MSQPVIAILMGSKSDLDLVQPASDLLTELGIGHQLTHANQPQDQRQNEHAKGTVAVARGQVEIDCHQQPGQRKGI